MAKKKTKGKSYLRVLVLVVLIAAVVGGIKLFSLYQKIYWPNVQVDNKSNALFIPTGATLEEVAGLLDSRGFIINRHSFEWLAERKNYRGNLIVPGKYELKDGMSNDALIDHLRAGNGRLEVRVTFNNIRTLEELSGRLGQQLEPDSAAIYSYLASDAVQQKYGFNRDQFITMFIPNTYHFDWATSIEAITERMASEYRSFWTAERKAKAQKIGLSQSEVVTLASIVQAEQRTHLSEQPTIAGLYLNRLKKGMKLQSDPTVIHANKDFTIRRVLTKHLEIDSPYNTYRYAGLPPGPILLPEISAVDAVLNAENNQYIFMCAKEDFSGYHHFSTTLRQHNIYAQRYRNALNQRNIYK